MGRAVENWTTAGLTCDNAIVEREHARRHEGSEVMAPGPFLWCGPAIVVRPPRWANYTEGGLLGKTRF